jgi:hypothetical protein
MALWCVKCYTIGSFEEFGLDERIIFKRILQEEGGIVWAGFIWLSVGTSEHGNEGSC